MLYNMQPLAFSRSSGVYKHSEPNLRYDCLRGPRVGPRASNTWFLCDEDCFDSENVARCCDLGSAGDELHSDHYRKHTPSPGPFRPSSIENPPEQHQDTVTKQCNVELEQNPAVEHLIFEPVEQHPAFSIQCYWNATQMAWMVL